MEHASKRQRSDFLEQILFFRSVRIFACVFCFLSTPWAIKMRKEY